MRPVGRPGRRVSVMECSDIDLRLLSAAPDVGLTEMAVRVAADPARKAVLTTRARMDASAPGPALRRTLEEMEEHLEADKENAVLLWSGSSWMAVFRDRSSPSKYVVSKSPTSEPENELGDKVPSAMEALKAAIQV